MIDLYRRYARSISSCLMLCFACAAPAVVSGQVVSLVQTSNRYAGTGSPTYSGDFGSATSVSLNQPSYMVLDSLGNQYVSDTGNNCVRKIDTIGNLTTVAGLTVTGQGDTCNTSSNATPLYTAGLYRPTGLAIDANSNLYIADAGHNCVRRLSPGTTGTASLVTVAGTCGPTTTTSQTPNPSAIVIDAASNLYVSLQDTETVPALSVYQVIRQSVTQANTQAVNATTLCVVAGRPSALNATTCSGITDTITLAAPSGLTFDFNGNLYVADTGNNCVRQVTGAATQPTTVGLCANDSTGSSTSALHSPFGIAFSLINSLIVSETSPDRVVRFISASGTLANVAGNVSGAAGNYSSTQDGVSAQNISLNQPRGLLVDSGNNFYVADSQNDIVRELSPNYTFPRTPVPSLSNAQPITFIVNQAVNLSASVGTDYVITSNTCTGALTAAASGTAPVTCQVFVRFSPTRPGVRNAPLVIKDSISGGLVSSSLQGVGTGSLGVFAPGTVNTVASGLNKPTAVSTDAAGNAYILEAGTTTGTADVRILTPAGSSSTLAIKAGTGLVTPSGIGADGAGNWYIVDAAQGTVTRYGADGTVNATFITGLVSPTAITVDGFGNLYIAQGGTAHNVIEAYVSGLQRVIAGSGTDTAANNVTATNAKFISPAGVFLDLNGILYIADSGGHRVFAIDKTGLIHILAGNGTTTTTTAGVAVGTGLVSPTSIAVDAASDVYIADSSANQVYVVYASSSMGTNIATVLGTGVAGNSGDGGSSILAKVSGPLSVALDGASDLFVVDSGNSSVREITYPTQTLAFGTVTTNTTSPVMVTYFADDGTDNLNLFSAIGTTDSHFAVNSGSTTCGVTVLSGAVCAIGFTFAPTSSIAYSGQSVLSSSSYNSPSPVNLTGNGRLMLALPGSTTAIGEVYGSGFPVTSTFTTTGTNPPATGTLTYSVGGVTICSVTGTISPSITCNAPNSGLSVGSYPVVVTYSGDSNYSPTTGSATLTVTPAPYTVVVSSASRPYGTANPTFTYTVTSGAVNGDVISVAGPTTTATTSSAPGTYPITVTLSSTPTATLSTNYTVTNTPGTLTITQSTLTISATSISRVYGSTTPAFTSTVTGAQNGDTFVIGYTVSPTYSQFSNAGSYTITPSITSSSNPNYASDYTVTPVTGTLTVTPASITISVPAASRPYGTANPTPLTGASTITGLLNGDTLTDNYTTTATIASLPGTYPITDTLTGAKAGNYTPTTATGTLTITKAAGPVTITLANQTRVYGAANPSPLDTSVTTGALNGDTFTTTYSTIATVTSPVGTYPITATVSGTALGNYTTVTTTTGTLTVTPAPLSVTANSFTRPFNTANPTLTGTITGILNGDAITATYSTTATMTSPVGTYPIVPTLSGAALSNYTTTVTNGTLTIVAASMPATITVNNATRVYGAANPTFTGTVTGAQGGDVLGATYSTTATATSPVGTYPITATLTGANASAYTTTVVAGTLTITAAPLNVTANSFTRPYGTVNPAFTGTTTGLVNGDTVTTTYATTATTSSPVGTYPIVPTVTGAALSNYMLTTTNGVLTITSDALVITVTPNNATRIYGTANPTLTGVVTGAVNGDVITAVLSTTATITSNVGTYPITAVLSGANAGNYTYTVVPGVFTITPAPTVTTLTGSGSPILPGGSVTFTATVTSAVGVPPGTVNFFDGTTLLGSGTVSATGVATFTTTSLSTASHSIVATYVPSTTNFSPSSSGTLTEIVNGTFSISANPPTAVIRGPGTTVYNVTLTSLSNFVGPVALTCSGLPVDATCTFAAPTQTLTAGGTATTTMMVTTTTADAKLNKPVDFKLNSNDLAPITIASILPFELTGLGALFAGMRRRKTLNPRKTRLLLLLVCSLGVLGLAGCGCINTAFKTYTINITGTSTAGTAPSASTSVVLTVGLPN